jgi:hypothetical protein
MKNIVLLALAVMIPNLVFAYEWPLSSETIREAYFLGTRRDMSTVHFIGEYTHHFPVPSTGPNVAMIQLETPYAEIVEHAENAVNYDATDAVQEFVGKPAEFRLRVQIYFTPSYNAIVESGRGKTVLRSDDFWRAFKIKLIQGTEIHPERVTGHVLYGNGGGNGRGKWIGAEVQLCYPASAIRSALANVEVLGPEGHETRTSFDLASLR